MLPGVINVAARSLATHALSILGDHQDIYATRSTGFAIMASSSVQCVSDLTIVSFLSAIEGSLPFLNFIDGFRTSHELSKIKMLEKSDVKDIIDFDKIQLFRDKALSIGNRVKGTAMGEDVYFQMAEVRNKDYLKLPDIVDKYMKLINKKTGKSYAPFEYYGSKNAKKVIVAMGSVCETIREVIDDLNEDIGLIEVHLYRPFSSKYFFDALPETVKKIAVLDRTKEPGSNGEPLYLDVVSLFNNFEDKPYIIGGRYGLSSKDTNPSHIKAVYDFLDSSKSFNGFTVGIDDDVTKLSIPVKDYHPITNSKEFLVYGYGSDGMVSAGKDILKIIGDNTDEYVQGYFQYDSKKSGGVTRGHIRINEKPIRSTYFIDNPSLVVCSKESYINKYDMLSNIKKNGTFVLVTDSSEKEVNELLSAEIKNILVKRNIKFYTINAYELASKYGLKNKISTILETCILDIIGYSKYINDVKESIKARFLKKGNDVIESNLKVVDEALSYLKEVKVKKDSIEFIEPKEEKYNKVFEMATDLDGNKLKVSDFLDYKDGSFIMGTTEHEKRNVAEMVPVWDKEKCIQCNQCSFVCPHAVIRPFLLDDKEIIEAPKTLKDKLRNAIGSKYQYTIGISKPDCTGCGLCANVCPAGALTMTPINQVKDNNNFEFLINKVKEKNDQINNTVKGSQFKKPLFEFSGACAGCGETPYIKLLTQLFGDKITIANATGCSSIYGGSFPSIPYKLPWANSLFEDNAEFGYGMLLAYHSNRNKIKEIMECEKDGPNKELFNKWLKNYDDYDITKEVYEKIDYSKSKLKDLKEYIISRDVWTVGGDGWAYDIGFSGIDHILATDDNAKILVLDTEVYSNTGGQSSKSSNRGSIAKFTADGKKNAKKDLARVAMSYPNVYVAQISMANMNAVVKAFVEADKHDGPSIIIAYAPCINHGIKGGLENQIKEQKLAVASGYFPIFRYNAKTKSFHLDSKEPDFKLLDEFIDNETRFRALKVVNEEKAEILFGELKEDVKKRYEYYEGLANK
ncbi:MAG TPA: pyruvate:ferredoxin (flavodoxin) oxidoreductase, partial [Bacilli bacterium]|nr:pyruvate:ferredoxin (flavodoxin) oxidoreductase [Bacilli bacterium]